MISFALVPLWQGLCLCGHMAKREIRLRYRASLLGFGWAVVYPLCMLGIYSLVFGVILNVRWGEASYDFVPALFCGLTGFNLFASLLSRAPVMVLEHRNYIRSSSFPVAVLPLIALATSLVDALVGFALLVAMNAIWFGRLHWPILWLPICVIPLVLLALGGAWLISSVAVYIRDLTSITPIFVTALFFLTPIIYPLSSIPEHLQSILVMNPLTGTIENLRNTVIWGIDMNWKAWTHATLIGLAVAAVGFAVFRRLQNGFSDAI